MYLKVLFNNHHNIQFSNFNLAEHNLLSQLPVDNMVQHVEHGESYKITRVAGTRAKITKKLFHAWVNVVLLIVSLEIGVSGAVVTILVERLRKPDRGKCGIVLCHVFNCARA